MAKIDHYCSWCNKFIFSEQRDNFEEDTQTHGMCEECELKLLLNKLPQMKAKLTQFKEMGLEHQSQIIANKVEKTEQRVEELESILKPTLSEASDSVSPVSLMRLTQINDPDELLKDHKREDIIIEEKLDGWKAQVTKSDGIVKIYSRRGEEKTENFPELIEALKSLPNGTLVEGELVYWHDNKQDVGKVTSIAGSNPDKAKEKAKEFPGKIKLHLYDVLWSKGINVSKKSFSERRKILKSIVKTGDLVLITKEYPFSEWEDAMNKAVSSGGEGIVLKIKDKPYEYKAKGENEPKPKGIMFKYKGGVGKSDSDDYVVYDYETTDKGNLKALFGQYYKGKLYHISDIGNFSKENENLIKRKLQDGNFVIEIGFQERVPGGLRHQKFVRFRDDKKQKDATMNEFHVKNIKEFKVVQAQSEFKLSKRAENLTPQGLLLELLQYYRSTQRGRGMPKAPSVPASLNFDPELGFKIISKLESGGKSWVRGDSGNSFGLTQVHGPYFMKWLSRNPQLMGATGIDPNKLAAMSDSWKSNLRKINTERNLWITVPVDQEAVRQFINSNPNSVVRRREGTTIRMNPGNMPGVVKKIGNRYVGREINVRLLKDKYGFEATSNNMAALQKISDTYVTPLVAKSAIAQLLTSQDNPETSAKFYQAFSKENVRKNSIVKHLSDWVSRSDFMAKMRFLVNDVIKSGYNPNVPGAYNMYQLMAITNGSGPYRVRRFLMNKKTFSAGHLHYLQRANPYISKVTGLPTNVIESGLAGFPEYNEKKIYAFLSKRGNDFDAPPEYSGQAGAIRALIEKWLNRQADISEFEPYGVTYVGKDENNVYITMSKKDIENIAPLMPKEIGGFVIKYQQPLTNTKIRELEVIKRVPREEFEDEPTVVDPFKGISTKYYSEILKEYEWYKAHMHEVLSDLKLRYNREFTEEEAAESIVNTIMQKYSTLTSGSQIRILLQKWAAYVEPGTLYFPGQYAEDIKSGKRRISIRPGDVNVKPDEHIKCKSYSGADIADVKILSKKVMSIIRIEKAYGKTIAKSLSRRFGPDKRFVLIEFEPLDINVADDGDEDQEKMSEVLIDKNKKLTRGQIKKHYMQADVRKKIMSRIKSKPILIYIGVGKNEKILKRNHNGKEIVITNDDPKNDDQPNNYFYWVNRRLLSIHQVFGTKTNFGFVDLDIHGDFSLEKAKKYARELSKKIKSKYGTPTIFNSGGTGLHVEFKLGQEMSIDKLRGELKELLDEFNKDWSDVTTGIVKGSGMRSDISTLHNKGSIRVPGSFGESNGNIKQSLGGNQDTAENNYINAPLWETKYDYNDPNTSFPESNIIQVAPPQAREPYDQHGAYNTVDDSFALSKRHVIKKSAKEIVDKEYIWLWDAENEKLVYHLNMDNGEFSPIVYSHLSLGHAYKVPHKVGETEFTGYMYFFKGSKDGEVHLYTGEPNKMPHKLIRSLELLTKNKAPKIKKMDLPKDTVGEIWKTKERQRQLEQHMEKRRWMGQNEPDPEFVEQLNTKFASAKKRIIMLLAPTDFYESEYFIPRRVFVEKYGFMVHVVSSGETANGTQGTVVNTDKNLSNVKAKKYDALFVCGGKGMISFSKNKEAQQLLRDFIEQEKPVGMICHGPLLAAEADVIDGREVTGWPDIVGRIKRAKGLWTGMPIERAGWIFTAVGPDEADDLAHIMANFLLGKETLIPAKDKLLDWKKAQAKLERIWKLAADQDDEEVRKFLEEHPELEEEEEPEEIETEQERMERANAPIKPKQVKKPKEFEKFEEPEEFEESEEFEKPEEDEIEEEMLKEIRPKYVGFRHIVKPEKEEKKPEATESNFDELFEPEEVKWEDTLSEEYQESEEGEDITEEKIPVFGTRLEPPMDKSGKILDRWFEAEEIDRPFMLPEAKELFTPDNMKDGPSLTKLFQNPDAWNLLKKNPEIAQKWILPAIIMGIGKRWFNNNSTQLKLGARQKDVGRTPFGMFDAGDIRLLVKGTPITELPSSKAYISLVNEIITDLANTYFSFGYRVDPPRGSLPLGGYIYKSLAREMSKHIAADKGYREIRVPVCSYCKSRKQKRQSKEVVYHAMEYVEGSKPKRWICVECKRKFEENEGIISTLNYDVETKQKEITGAQRKLTQIITEFTEEPTFELKEKRKEYEDRILSLTTDVKHTKTDLDNLNKIQYSLEVHIQGVPYWHTWCPNPGCPGNRVPLTAIDRKNGFWQTDAGVKASEILQKRFGVTINSIQEAEDDEDVPRILPQRIPPDELLDVPFICPHDYVEFTLRNARGKGLQKKGGFFWEPWQHMLWDRIGKEEISVEEENMGGVAANQEENLRNQVVQRTSLYLSSLGAKLFSDQYKNSIREYNTWFTKQVEVYREKGKPIVEAVKKVEQSRTNGAKQRSLSMYQTLGETSHLDPGMFVSWLSEVSVENEFIVDKEGNIEERNVTEKIKPKDRRDNVYIPTLHAWISKMMDSRSDWFKHYKMEDILANQKADGIYSSGPGTFFIAKIGDEIMGEDKDIAFGFGCGLVPAHKEYPKINPFSYTMTEEEEKWTLPSKNPKKVPLRYQTSIKPKVLKFIGLWKIPSDHIDFVNKHPEWMGGSAPIPLNNKVIDYAKSHPEDNLAGEIMYSDYYRVALNETDSSFSIGEYVLVQALVMPGKYNPEPVVDLRNIRNKSDTHQQIFSRVGALMNEKPVDPESKALLKEFFEDIENYGDDPEEMKMAMEDLVRGFEDLKKRKASSFFGLISNAGQNVLYHYAPKDAPIMDIGLMSPHAMIGTEYEKNIIENYGDRVSNSLGKKDINGKDVEKYLDKFRGPGGSRMISAFLKPIPNDSSKEFKDYISSHDLYIIDYKSALENNIISGARIVEGEKSKKEEIDPENLIEELEDEKTPSWKSSNDKLFSKKPHAMIELVDGILPPKYIKRSFPKKAFQLSIRASDPLSTYKKKRKFDETSEPEGKTERRNKHRFVIQKHYAEKAGEHLDLRLENDEGAMSSWAIPKHKLPSGKERLLAVKTEDHPVSYNKFEGDIPKGEYGAGKVEIYDSGTYEELEGRQNKIVFRLKGKKEKNIYKIFKTDGKKWMIMEEVEDMKKKSFYLSKRALEVEKLDRIPIMPVEMWTDFQLVQSMRQPELFINDQEKFKNVKQEVLKRSLKGKPKNMDI